MRTYVTASCTNHAAVSFYPDSQNLTFYQAIRPCYPLLHGRAWLPPSRRIRDSVKPRLKICTKTIPVRNTTDSFIVDDAVFLFVQYKNTTCWYCSARLRLQQAPPTKKIKSKKNKKKDEINTTLRNAHAPIGSPLGAKNLF